MKSRVSLVSMFLGGYATQLAKSSRRYDGETCFGVFIVGLLFSPRLVAISSSCGTRVTNRDIVP